MDWKEGLSLAPRRKDKTVQSHPPAHATCYAPSLGTRRGMNDECFVLPLQRSQQIRTSDTTLCIPRINILRFLHVIIVVCEPREGVPKRVDVGHRLPAETIQACVLDSEPGDDLFLPKECVHHLYQRSNALEPERKALTDGQRDTCLRGGVGKCVLYLEKEY